MLQANASRMLSRWLTRKVSNRNARSASGGIAFPGMFLGTGTQPQGSVSPLTSELNRLLWAGRTGGGGRKKRLEENKAK